LAANGRGLRLGVGGQNRIAHGVFVDVRQGGKWQPRIAGYARSTNVARPEPKSPTPLDPAAQQIASTLGESEPAPLMHIRRIVQTLGSERAVQLLAQALAVESEGGLMLLDGSRRRTPGGVFFRLVREQTTPAASPGRKKAKPRRSPTDADPAA
jgi:PHAX RNA-binding domain-containing protein